jgi:hypothetical protein
MKTITAYPDKTWSSRDDAKETMYNRLVIKLDNMGRPVDLHEAKDILCTFRQRVYALPRGTVRLIERIDSSLNQYNVTVQLDVYASSDRSAKRLLEDILKQKTA